jgi:ribosomal protein L37AE/L43A
MSAARDRDNLPQAAAWDTICSQCGRKLAVVRFAGGTWGSDNLPLCEECNKQLADPARPAVFVWERVRQECAGKPPRCTELLDDPVGVLSDRQRWPTHLCYEPFMRWSTEEWVLRTTMRTNYTGAAVTNWHTRWPLAVGRRAVENDPFLRRVDGWAELLNIVPFEEDQEALWALHVERGSAVLDLFGLAAYPTEDCRKDGVVTVGELRINSLRWDRTLHKLVGAAEHWWSRFQGLSIDGRPPGSGIWASEEQFKDDLRNAVSTLREQGRKITQEEVSNFLHCEVSTVKRWLRDSDTSWIDEKTR